MNQYQANLGNTALLNQSTRVVAQYSSSGAQSNLARGNFAPVFDTPIDENDTRLQIYNLVTWLGPYEQPGETDGRLAILGKITFGIGGVTVEADFDWKAGTQLSMAASFVRVAAAFSEVGPESPDTVRIGAMISSGSRAARSQVTRTFPRLLVDADHTVLFPVPPYAHALNLFSDNPDFYTADEFLIRYLGAANNGLSTTSTSLLSFQTDGLPFLAGLSSDDGVRFPEAARWVEISTAGAELANVTPCFTLSF